MREPWETLFILVVPTVVVAAFIVAVVQTLIWIGRATGACAA